jgi:2-polyprenyl-3-methyl-5-hydroxy-6-metoxy-1,4-benzoquinol methylase
MAGLQASPRLSLLDVGCAMGTFFLQARRVGLDVPGLELSRAEAVYARDQRGLTVHECSIESKTSFRSGSFDMITMFGVIEHLANPGAA